MLGRLKYIIINILLLFLHNKYERLACGVICFVLGFVLSFDMPECFYDVFPSTKTSGLNFRQFPSAKGTAAFLKISKKEDNLARYTQISNFFHGIFLPFNFAPGVSTIVLLKNGSHFGN